MKNSPTILANALQGNPAALELDRRYGGHTFARAMLVLQDLDGSNLEIAQAKAIIKTRRESAERKAHGNKCTS